MIVRRTPSCSPSCKRLYQSPAWYASISPQVFVAVALPAQPRRTANDRNAYRSALLSSESVQVNQDTRNVMI